MNTQESRDAFENWMKAENPHIGVGKREGDGYWQYSANLMWQAWQASRTALKGPVDVESAQIFGSIEDRIAHLSKLEPLMQLRELLAVLHGDGGHYSDEHGIPKAIADAEVNHYSVQRDVEEGRLREALEEIADGWCCGSPDCCEETPQCDVRRARAALLPTELREDKSDV